MGKKREKGKARKAKAAAALGATQEAPFNAGASTQQAMVESEAQEWRFWAAVGRTQGCTHGCPVLPAPDHAVSRFMDALWVKSENSFHFFMTKQLSIIDKFGDDATLRKFASDIMVAIGTNIITTTDNLNKAAVNYVALTISVLEQYNGNDGNHGLNLAMCKASLVADDLLCGGEREIIRFFLKRISCTCLKAKYSLLKKFQPTRISGCSICKQLKVRKSMMLCGRCRAKQYCCEKCQAADWPNHKTLCRIIHEQRMKNKWDHGCTSACVVDLMSFLSDKNFR